MLSSCSDFECLVAWLATHTDKGTVKRLLRIDWDTVARIVKRVCDEAPDDERGHDLFDIGIDEVSWSFAQSAMLSFAARVQARHQAPGSCRARHLLRS